MNLDSIKLAEDTTQNNAITNAPPPIKSNTEFSTAPSDTSTTTQSSDNTTPKAPKAYKLDAVTVTTATGYTQDIKDAPASITIVPKEELTSRPIRDLGDALQEVPGVATEIDKTGQSVISMRGLGSAYTLILIDGKRQNTSQGFGGRGISPQSVFMPPVSMIERIEVIRGPASLLYGSDTIKYFGATLSISSLKRCQIRPQVTS